MTGSNGEQTEDAAQTAEHDLESVTDHLVPTIDRPAPPRSDMPLNMDLADALTVSKMTVPQHGP